MVMKVDFVVVGKAKLNCEGCESRVRFALERLPGVQQVLADHTTQHVAVMLNPEQVSVQAVQERLLAAGYEVRPSA